MDKLLDIPAEQTSSTEVDEEILDIFREEVGEVLEEMRDHFQRWRDNPEDVEALRTLRRNFHTLKGSGRLVGAMVIGELGWQFENLLNKTLDSSIPNSPITLELVAKALHSLPNLVEDFTTQRATPYSIRVLISEAYCLVQSKGTSKGQFPPEDQLSSVVNKETTSSVPKKVKKPEVELASPLKNTNAPALPDKKALDLVAEKSLQEDQDAFSTLEDEIYDSLDEDQNSLTTLEAENEQSLAEDRNNLSNLEEGISGLEEEFGAESTLFETDTLEQINFLDQEGTEGNSEQENSFNLAQTDPELSLDDLDSLSLSEDITPIELSPLDSSIELSGIESTPIQEGIDPTLLAIFEKETRQHLADLTALLNAPPHNLSSPELEQQMMRAFHSLNGSSRSVGFTAISKVASPLEAYTRTLMERGVSLPTDKKSLLEQAVALMAQLLSGSAVSEISLQSLLDNIQLALEALPAAKVVHAKETEDPSEESFPDASDEFMMIFLDEADEILENTQSLLERWQNTPNNMGLMKELQRELHTLKGGSRMVGIAPMGDLSHNLESVLTKIVEGGAHTNPKLQEVIQNSVDELAAMLEAIRSGVPLEMPNDLINQINQALTPEGEKFTDSVTPLPLKENPPPLEKEPLDISQPMEKVDKETDQEGGEDRIRVRVALIERLTGLAGELTISRAHMEQQQALVKGNLGEMEQTVSRLRDQLRRLEIETEAQILSHFNEYRGNPLLKQADQEEFDPLELDRFSVMQQLSRSLMESINDLVNIQDSLKVLTRQTDTLLIQQTRIGAELQDAIMRTRMIPFARISPRLQRIARLTAREIRKQVDFVINGENIEFERTVLNRIVAPLEHMLRNAIGHGIEETAIRQQSGKPPIAKISIDLAKEGAELVIKLSDDGAGLNLTAIRKKAEERRLIKPDTVISDHDLMQFILEPSFSTAKVVTQISGRGVGMDVVNSEIKQLSGSLQIHSQTGFGTSFEIRLPISLTVNQALLVHVGEDTLALPMNNVDAVMRAPRAEVMSTEEVRYHKYMEYQYRIFHLGELLGFGKATIDTPLIPVLLVRTGDRRVALLVDSIEGSKEIVVKSVGPQIGSIRWIAGATILGDGRVVLILDVPTLVRSADKTQTYVAPSISVEQEEKPQAKTIMVVDDSITVRKVTARLLKRQGMEVLTAKDGVDAVAQLQEHIPDLMLLDVEMPRMDGYELATQIRNSPELKEIPIIMITSRTGTKHRDRAEKIGIDRYLGKPFNETELLENINALLAERAAKSQNLQNH